MSDKRYRVTYTGNDVVRLGRGGVFMAGTVALCDEEVAREAAGRSDFSVEGLGAPEAPAAASKPPVAEAPAAASKPPVAEAASSKPPAEKAEKKAEAKPAEEKKAEAKPAAEEKKGEAKPAEKAEAKPAEAAKPA